MGKIISLYPSIHCLRQHSGRAERFAMHKSVYTVTENTQLTHVVICTPSSTHKNIHISFILETNATARVELLVAHTDAVITIECVLRGEASRIIVNGAYLLHELNNVSITTLQHHEAAHTTSRLVMKGIVDGAAHVQYAGMIRVEKAARCSDALQENKNILLSNQARAVSVPSLEVLTNDVHCFHGSTLGRFDQDHLFYAASRGIDEMQARRLLVHAFFGTMFENKKIKMLLGELV